jgi:hypothetical protein
MSERNTKIIIVLGLVIFLGAILLQKINLPAADLGRHIINGELFITQHKILATNFYSYTYPDFPFVNHHWGSGVIFYLVYKLFSFAGLSWFYSMIGILTFLLFFDVARREAGVKTAGFVSIIFIPLLAVRAEVRPEAFSYLFAGIIFWLSYRVWTGKINWKYLFLVFLSSVLWVNLHIYFVFGFGIIGAFFISSIVKYLKRKDAEFFAKVKFFIWSLVLVFIGSLINPFFFKGLQAPLNIFQDYGYRIVENQSVYFLSRIIPYPASRYFLIGLSVLFISLLLFVWERKLHQIKFNLPFFIFSVFFSLIGFLMVRNFTLFAYFAIPLTCFWLKPKVRHIEGVEKENYFLTYFVLIFSFFLINVPFWQHRSFGAGLEQGVNLAAEFYKSNGLKGPIMNNYDIGGYLIYHLYPRERVFVDNRPEVYPSGFFQNTYIPMQENKEVWKEMDEKYLFQTVFFYRLDMTPWAQSFLISLLEDKAWSPVFVDDYNIIFVKTSGPNASIAEKFRIPRETFQISH